MTTTELYDWMKEETNQGNCIPYASVGNGGAGFGIIKDAERECEMFFEKYDDNDIRELTDEDICDDLKEMDYPAPLNEHDAVFQVGYLQIVYYDAKEPDVIECGADYLCYMFLGKQYDVSGEFYKDSEGKRHHEHICATGRVIDIVF